MEWNREPRKRLTQIYSTKLWQRCKDNLREKSFQQMRLEQLDIHMKKKKKKNSDTDFAPITKLTQNGS